MKSNLDPKVESALCYIPFVGWIAAIIFLIIETNKDVRFNAVQSLLVAVLLWAVSFVLGLTIILLIISPVVWIGGIILQIVLAFKAYQGQKVTLPMVSDWSEKLLTKLNSSTAKK